MAAANNKQWNEHTVIAVPRTVFGSNPDYERFRREFQEFIRTEIRPNRAKYDAQGFVDKELFRKAAKAGWYCRFAIPKQYGGLGLGDTDFLYSVIVNEELEYADMGSVTFSLGVNIVLPYFSKTATEAQRARWLPRIAEGAIIAVAMSEPQAGSDLAGIKTTAVRADDGSGDWILNGRKMWITNGGVCDLCVIAAYSDPAQGHRGLSLFVVERERPGFETRTILKKLGRDSQDTAILALTNVRVPAENLLATEGRGFATLMSNLAQERLDIAIAAAAQARRVLSLTVQHCHRRKAFGRPLGALQDVAFTLAELRTTVSAATVFVDRCIELHLQKQLNSEQASMAKLLATEMLNRTCDRCLQLFGGYGYLKDGPIGRAFVDSRVTSIYGGASAVMKEIIAKSLGFTRARL